MRCCQEALNPKFKKFSSSYQVMSKLLFSQLLCLMTSWDWQNISWENQKRFLLRVKTLPLKVLVNTILLLKKKIGRWMSFWISTLIWISTKLLFIAILKRECLSLKKQWMTMISLSLLCMVKWTKSREIQLWKSSELVQLESSLLLIS